MNKKTIFIGIAILALIVQILFPVWWTMVAWGIFEFVVEGIIELGFEFNTIFIYLFFFYSIIALVSAIWSFFSIRGIESNRIYMIKKNVWFIIINSITIVLSIIFVIINKGIFPNY